MHTRIYTLSSLIFLASYDKWFVVQPKRSGPCPYWMLHNDDTLGDIATGSS